MSSPKQHNLRQNIKPSEKALETEGMFGFLNQRRGSGDDFDITLLNNTHIIGQEDQPENRETINNPETHGIFTSPNRPENPQIDLGTPTLDLQGLLDSITSQIVGFKSDITHQNTAIFNQVGLLNNKIDNFESRLHNIEQEIELVKTKLEDQERSIMNKILQSIDEKIKHQTIKVINEEFRSNSEAMDEVNAKMCQELLEINPIKKTNEPHSNPAPDVNIMYLGQHDSIIPPARFDGRDRNPVAVLDKLKSYVNKTENRHKILKGLPPFNFTDAIENCLTGSASMWWQINKERIHNIELFEIAFRNKYWNDDIQWAIKEKLNQDKFKPDGRLTRSEYFTERAIVLKTMTPQIVEKDIIKIMARHFDEHIRRACIIHDITTVSKMEELLNLEDLEYNQKNTQLNKRPYQRPNPQTNIGNERWNNQQNYHQNQQNNAYRNQSRNYQGNNNRNNNGYNNNRNQQAQSHPQAQYNGQNQRINQYPHEINAMQRPNHAIPIIPPQVQPPNNQGNC